MLRLPEVGADKFVESLPRPAKGRLEKLAAWSDGGCIPAPRRLEGIEWALAVYGTARAAEVDLVTIRSDRWIHYDPSGKLGRVLKDCGTEAAEAEVAEEGRAAACARIAPRRPAGVEVEDEIWQGAPGNAVPWQTPHCVDKDGQLLMVDAAQKWLNAKSREREELLEELGADAGESKFRVLPGVRAQWLVAQASDAEIQKLVQGHEADKNYRKSPEGRLIERWIVEPGTGHEHWVPVVNLCR